MKSYEEFEKSLSKEVKEKAKKMFDKMYEPYKNDEPLILVFKSEDDEKFVKKVESIKKPEGEE